MQISEVEIGLHKATKHMIYTETQREPEKEKEKGKTLAIFLPGKQKFLESRLAN